MNCTRELVAILAELDQPLGDYPPQDVWWWRYQALIASNGMQSEVAEIETLDDQRYVLQQAYRLMLAGIETLSDAGLTRNYLNKVIINREILLEWNAWQDELGLPVTLPSTLPGNLQQQFQRLLAIGARMNTPRPVAELLDLIVAQVIELTGAERFLLVLMAEDGKRTAAASFGYTDGGQQALVEYRALLDNMAAAPRPLLSETPDGLSRMVVPLAVGNTLLGMILVETASAFGPFSETDLDLLAAFANQAAAALENARLVEGLELRVAERTADLQELNAGLEQRNAELAVINSIQRGLASELEIQGILNLVGDELQRIFGVSEIEIATYDPDTRMISIPYWSTSEGRVHQDPLPLGRGIMSQIIQTGQPVIMTDENMDEIMAIAIVPEGEVMRRSFIGAPIISNRGTVGAIALHEPHLENAYTPAQLRLLTTIAASLGTALENARLFDETQRLLRETEERNAELAIINSVQQGLASKLNMDEIYTLVGDRLVEVTQANTLIVTSFDFEQGIRHWHYGWEKGERYFEDPDSADFTPGFEIYRDGPHLVG